jgi:predicted ATPase
MRLRKDYPRLLATSFFETETQSRVVQDALDKLVSTTWLSIHRKVSGGRDSRSDFESTVDEKLIDIINDLVRYFSELDKEGRTLLQDFQRQMFLAIISGEEPQLEKLDALDLEVEENALVSIYQELDVQVPAVKEAIGSHFKTLRSALSKQKANGVLEGKEFAAFIDTLRIHKIVGEFKVMKNEQERVFELRNKFINQVNGFLSKKSLEIGANNEISVCTKSGKTLHPTSLSSGEKQLLILLSEAVLSRRRTHIYIADEPELSLHVTWQEKLLSSLVEFNPNAQLIVATHSPDIVGDFRGKVFDMEECLH